MTKIPSEAACLEFFGRAPALADIGVPWAYNILEFAHDDWRVVIEPAEGTVLVELRTASVELSIPIRGVAVFEVLGKTSGAQQAVFSTSTAGGNTSDEWRLGLTPRFSLTCRCAD
ncbi:MAG: hypothetical protein HY828_10315 [Actinobacteria bacterium]|nr:hypothetical protein [Actinomycetota bacterium]